MGYVGMSDYALAAILKHLHGETSYTAPTDTYLAVFVGNPLSTGTEVSGGSYARQAVTWNGVASGTQLFTDENEGEIAFPEATADWGIVTHFATYDALTVGNMLEVFELDTSRDVKSGDTLLVKDGNLDSYLKRESI
ncbi:MAG: hypothetical protein WC248_07760 [Candidatus Methanomethylophilaceae archaeon]|jgi:hypothetical protein